MKGGPSESAIRCLSQATASCCRQEAKAVRRLVDIWTGEETSVIVCREPLDHSMSASANCGHAVANAYDRVVPIADVSRCSNGRFGSNGGVIDRRKLSAIAWGSSPGASQLQFTGRCALL